MYVSLTKLLQRSDNLIIHGATFFNTCSTDNAGFCGLQTYYYLQTLLTGDTETRRNPALLLTRKPLAVKLLHNLINK